MRKLLLVLSVSLCSYANIAIAASDSTLNHSPPANTQPITVYDTSNPVQHRFNEEKKIPPYFGISFHNPNYVLPYYYTGSPDYPIYRNRTPNNEEIKHGEVKYQFSLKIPVWKNIYNSRSSLYLAYTQLSYWQLYSPRTFFRETNYEPEILNINEMHKTIYRHWQLDFLNAGYLHQSNGLGTDFERSWNRLYLEAITTVNNWTISIKPWIIISKNNKNNDIAKFLGYGRFLVAYQYGKQVFSIQAHNLIESGARRATAELTWSFPLTRYIKGYVQGFSGYGQSLIEYNHRSNSVGVGVAVSDWV